MKDSRGSETIANRVRNKCTVLALLASCTLGMVPERALSDDIATDARECAAKASPADRLRCFDVMFGKDGLTATPSTAMAGSWHLSVDKSPNDDSTSLYAALGARDVSGGAMFDASEATLFVRCRERKLSAYVTGNVFFDVDATESVSIRLGQEPARQAQWSTSTNGRAIGLWGDDGPRTTDFVRSLMTALQPSLVIRAESYHAGPMTAQFDLTGAKDALTPLLDLCSASALTSNSRPMVSSPR